MYEVIGQRRSVRKLYTETLVNRGDLTLEAVRGSRSKTSVRASKTRSPRRRRRNRAPVAWFEHEDAPRSRPARDRRAARASRHDRRRARDVPARLHRAPEARTHPRRTAAPSSTTTRSTGRSPRASRSARCCWKARRCASPARTRGAARSASGTRPSSTTTTEAEYTPLAHLPDAQAPFMIYDSVLSEFAALGFEYGYSVADRDALVAWEAQFGDFMNGAQTIIDQFIVAAEDKWGQHSGLVLLLPHGFEGQGPEHSSARLERFLELCAEDNMRVVYPSTAAQYFHVLRRQVHDPMRKPLIVLTPKRYLRMPATRSPVDGVRRTAASGSCSPDPANPRPTTVRRADLLHRQVRPRAARDARRDAARRSRSCASSSCTRGPNARSAEQLAPLPRRRSHLGAGGAGQHGRPLLRPPPHRGARATAGRSASSPAPRARAPPPAARPCTTPSSRSSSKKRSPFS